MALADAAMAELNQRGDSWELAMAHGYRGEVDRAFELLQRYIEDLDPYHVWILVEPAYQSLHADPRWRVLMEKLGLLEFWLEMERD